MAGSIQIETRAYGSPLTLLLVILGELIQPQECIPCDDVASWRSIGRSIVAAGLEYLHIGWRQPTGTWIGQPFGHRIRIVFRPLKICRRRIAQIRVPRQPNDDGVMIIVHWDSTRIDVSNECLVVVRQFTIHSR